MSTTLYLQLSALMFMEYAVWGAWMPVLAARLLGPLQMTGKQTGWIYATLPLASMISPLFGSGNGAPTLPPPTSSATPAKAASGSQIWK